MGKSERYLSLISIAHTGEGENCWPQGSSNFRVRLAHLQYTEINKCNNGNMLCRIAGCVMAFSHVDEDSLRPRPRLCQNS